MNVLMVTGVTGVAPEFLSNYLYLTGRERRWEP